MRRHLWIALAVVATVAIVSYAWQLLARERLLSPAELAEIALTADTPQQREEAAVQLIRHGSEARHELRRVLTESDTPEVRAASIQALAALRDYDSMDALLDALDAPTALVRARAGQAVDRLLGAKYGFRYDAPPEARAKQIELLRHEWEGLRDSEQFRQYVERLQRP